MKISAVSGIVFANSNDGMLKKLTTHRSMASVPFGARYRMIDFSLSNLVNAGITNVGIITKGNYRSLMDHVGNGIHWELDRKNGGLYFLPPYLTGSLKRYNGTVEGLYGAIDYIKRCKSELIVLCNSDVLANVDIKSALKYHKENGADITIVYSNNLTFKYGCADDMMSLSVDQNKKVTAIGFESMKKDKSFSIGVQIINRELLLKLVYEAHDQELFSFYKDVIPENMKKLNIFGFEHKEYAALMDSTTSYYNANMDLLKEDVRQQLFNKNRPIYTKTRDDMPTRYGTESKVKNSLIANGCVIEGSVKNSILSRGVKVEKGAVVENCILMQETTVGKNAQIKNVISDKNSAILEDMVLKGTANKHFFIKKNQTI